MISQVALVLETDFADKLRPIASQMPIWVVKSDANSVIVAELRHKNDNCEITEFVTKQSESVVELFHRIIFSLDDHYNEYSQEVPYATLLVYGLDFKSVDTSLLAELKFTIFHKTDYGFIAEKTEE